MGRTFAPKPGRIATVKIDVTVSYGLPSVLLLFSFIMQEIILAVHCLNNHFHFIDTGDLKTVML